MSKGFFNIAELLICCIIIVIVATFIFMYANPTEINRRSRDAIRMSDLSNLQQVINLMLLEKEVIDPYVLCFNLPSPCSESSYPKNLNSNKVNGTGWIKINFQKDSKIFIHSVLPIDPLNTAAFNYTYTGKGQFFKLTTILESEKYKNLMQNDGGKDSQRYEVGNNLNLD